MKRMIVVVLSGVVLLLGLGYWRGSQVSWLRASHEVAASPERASATILAPQTLARYFPGVRRVDAEPTWPAVGSRMTWTIGGGLTFTARVLENRLPASIHLAVRTPSADSLITQRFERLGENRTLYEKVCEVHHRGLNRIFGPLLTVIIRRSLRQEVVLAAAAAAD